MWYIYTFFAYHMTTVSPREPTVWSSISQTADDKLECGLSVYTLCFPPEWGATPRAQFNYPLDNTVSLITSSFLFLYLHKKKQETTLTTSTWFPENPPVKSFVELLLDTRQYLRHFLHNHIIWKTHPTASSNQVLLRWRFYLIHLLT